MCSGVAEAENRVTGVVDAHTHVFWPELVADRERFLGRDAWFGELYRDPRAGLVIADELLASMELSGIAQSVICGFPWADIGLCRAHNDYMAEVAAASDGRLAWLAIVPPQLAAEAVEEIERCRRLGAVGLGELNADAQGFDLAEPDKLAEVMTCCVALDWPVMIHCSEPTGHRYPGKGTATPDRVVRFLQRFPDVRLVAAHWGGGLPFYELMPEVAELMRHVVYDSAASTYLYRFDVFRTVVDLVGADRVMFASDFPILGQRRFLGRVEKRGRLTDHERSFVLGQTARRVYRLLSSHAGQDSDS